MKTDGGSKNSSPSSACDLSPLSIAEEMPRNRENGLSTMSYFHCVGEKPFLGMTFGALIEDTADRFGDREAIVVPFQNVRRSFRQLKEDVDNFATGITALGLKRGDRIAIWSPNSYEAYLTQLAGWKAGLIVVCINAGLRGRELLYVLNKVAVRCIIISNTFKTQNFYEILTSSVPEIPTTKPGFLKSPHAPHLEFVISVEDFLPGTISFKDVLKVGENNMLIMTQDALTKLHFDDVCSLFFTSGTTGSPKATPLTHNNLLNNGYFAGRRMQLKLGDRICLPVPLFHVYGCQIGIFAALCHGATCILPSFGYDAKALLDVCSTERCNYVIGTPTMFSDMLKLSEVTKPDLRWLRNAVTGGAVCPLQVVRDLKTKLSFKRVISNYGMTEIGCTFMSLTEDSDELSSITVGVPLEHVEVKLVDKHGNIVPIGQEGELLVRSYAVTHGYWGEPEKTSEALETSKWFHTGDIFVMQESGHGRVVGRIKEMVNRGGENVYPKEVEDFLKTHPKIQDAQVFGVPDERMGEVPAVWIQLKHNELLTASEVFSYCRGQIAHFKIPKYVLFRDDFPRTPLGKVQKFRLREETLKVLTKM